MPEKRRDNRGRVLRNGESQRKDGQYVFQYVDASKKRRSVYSWRLVSTDKAPDGKRGDEALRDKEKRIQRDILDGITSCDSTVGEYLQDHIQNKVGLKRNSLLDYERQMKSILSYRISKVKVSNLTIADVKRFTRDLKSDGKTNTRINRYLWLLSNAFESAVKYDYIRKNPFEYRLKIPKSERKKRESLTSDQEHMLLDAVKNDKFGKRYYELIFILLKTGLRISELLGLTVSDIDFIRKRIFVNKQLQRDSKTAELFVETTKTKAGVRYIPLSDDVCEAFQTAINKRPKNADDITVDGYSRFIFINRRGNVMNLYNVEYIIRSIINRYNKTADEDNHLPRITPHTLRHTFCSNLIASGMNIKHVQYLMGHEDIKMTLGVYAHADYERVKDEMERLCM